MKTPSAMITQEKNNQCLEDPNKSHLVFLLTSCGESRRGKGDISFRSRALGWATYLLLPLWDTA